MLNRLEITALEGRLAAAPAKMMKVDAQVKANIKDDLGVVEVKIRVLRILEPDLAETDPKNTVPHFIGAVSARGQLIDPSNPPTKPELIQEMWPTISVTLNDHARRLGASGFAVPLQVSDLQLGN